MARFQDFRQGNGYKHITDHGESFLTDQQLSYLKDLWRMSDNWHPVDSLFLIIPEIERHFLCNVSRLMLAYDMSSDEAISIVGGIIFSGSVC